MANQAYYIEIDGQQIPVTEEAYRAYKRPLWAERKRQQRAHEREADLSVEKFLNDGLAAGQAPGAAASPYRPCC